MKKKIFLFFIPVSILLLLIHVAASLLNLAGSDPAPYEKKFNSFCYSNVQIQAPLDNLGGGNDYKVREVIVTGDFSGCQGHTILLSAQMNTSQISYAFYIFNGNETQVSLKFDSGQGDGVWHKHYPLIVNGQLVANGPLTPPSGKLAVEDISWIISFFW